MLSGSLRVPFSNRFLYFRVVADRCTRTSGLFPASSDQTAHKALAFSSKLRLPILFLLLNCSCKGAVASASHLAFFSSSWRATSSCSFAWKLKSLCGVVGRSSSALQPDDLAGAVGSNRHWKFHKDADYFHWKMSVRVPIVLHPIPSLHPLLHREGRATGVPPGHLLRTFLVHRRPRSCPQLEKSNKSGSVSADRSTIFRLCSVLRRKLRGALALAI